MIFVTVGTHEQPFNRLVKHMDLYQRDHNEEKVVIQTGYSDYQCEFAEGHKFLSFQEMDEYITKADVIITHGGPSSFLAVIEKEKAVIVVPREFKYGEHVNNHQVDFLKKISELYSQIIPVYNIIDLDKYIKKLKTNRGKKIVFHSNNDIFNTEMSDLLKKLLN
ncbi:glycosyltransferase [Pediococcus pentosaceus]|uniref:glycosyltransferase n=1 Tax=Pediococcus pentosaceus TaxID=1255 RepID=UPI0011B6E7D0|nr:glycosyltransferase [Pediococcus pentosaceus]MEB3376387.1 glycosyltransferase [Pediococcus pentosaceus]QDZ69682.1 glycosyltransferase [Pediococcus pentosaceus]